MRQPDEVTRERADEDMEKGDVAKGDAIPMPEPSAEAKAELMDREREDEQEEGIAAKRRGSRAAPSDRPENRPPHPQDVNEIGEEH
ncbi:MAG TPA: hypothetical protein VGA16_05905 [Candidatus Limnocylindria bacterium]